MANDLNSVVLIGRLTRDPEIKAVGASKVASFSIANNRSYLVNGTKKEETFFFDCEAWGPICDVLQKYAPKGKQVAISGRLVQSVWDGQDGKKNSKIKIRIENLFLLGSNSTSNTISVSDKPDLDYSTDINEEDTVF